MKNNKRGFTLVELVVVIAIIAVLAAVIIPSVSGYIEKARLTSDSTYVASLNKMIEYYELENDDISNLTASDIRTILSNQSDENLNFTTKSKNVGMFYNDKTKRIELIKYNDLINNNYQLSSVLLSDNSEIFKSPEELFIPGLHLLTTKGDIYSEVVYGLRSLAKEKNISAKFTEIQSKVNNLNNSTTKTKLQNLLDFFNYEEILYVNNTEWRTTKELNSDLDVVLDFNYVMFAEGITNIPTNNLKIFVRQTSEIVVPASVKTIEDGSFTKFFDTINLKMPGSRMQIANGAFSNDQLIKNNIIENGLPIITLNVNYRTVGEEAWNSVNPGQVLDIYVSNDLNNENVTELQFVLTNNLKSKLTEFSLQRVIENNKTYYIVKLYGSEGLIGVNRFEVNIIDLDVNN